MNKQTTDVFNDLDALRVPEAEIRRAEIPRIVKPKRHVGRGIWFPESIGTELSGAPMAVWCTMHCLLWLEFKAWVKDEPLVFTNAAAKRFGLSRKQKRRALDWLAHRGIVSVAQEDGRNPRVRIIAPH
jgi:hypothetical protein